MVPLEKRVDYLAFKNGYKFPIPFDCMLIFATNLNPLELVDEAFLRRIRYKILVESPNREQYDEIFRRCCESRDIVFDRSRVDQIYDGFYQRLQMAPRGCHPRDIVDTICNCAKYEGIPAALTDELINQACRTYRRVERGRGSGQSLSRPEPTTDHEDPTSSLTRITGRARRAARGARTRIAPDVQCGRRRRPPRPRWSGDPGSCKDPNRRLAFPYEARRNLGAQGVGLPGGDGEG
jgi:hypothetical protein